MSFILPKLYPIINCDTQQTAEELLFKLLASSQTLIQLRAKELSDDKFSFFLEALLNKLTATQLDSLKLIINDRVEIAKKFPIGGMHLGQEDIAPTIARKILGQNAIIGYSTHTLAQVEAAQALPVNYLGFGPIFLSKSKHGHADPTGLDNLKQAVRISKIPIVAIGGINQSNIQSVYATGVNSVAMISGLAEAFR